MKNKLRILASLFFDERDCQTAFLRVGANVLLIVMILLSTCSIFYKTVIAFPTFFASTIAAVMGALTTYRLYRDHFDVNLMISHKIYLYQKESCPKEMKGFFELEQYKGKPFIEYQLITATNISRKNNILIAKIDGRAPQHEQGENLVVLEPGKSHWEFIPYTPNTPNTIEDVFHRKWTSVVNEKCETMLTGDYPLPVKRMRENYKSTHCYNHTPHTTE